MTTKKHAKLTSDQKKSPKKRFIKITSIIVVVIAILLLAWYLLSRFLNPAYYAAKPLEAALIKAGAEKACSTGDWGIGPDNLVPWYSATFVIQKDTEAARSTVIDAAKQAGITLVDVSTDKDTYDLVDDKTKDKNEGIGIGIYRKKGEGYCNPPIAGSSSRTIVDLGSMKYPRIMY